MQRTSVRGLVFDNMISAPNICGAVTFKTYCLFRYLFCNIQFKYYLLLIHLILTAVFNLWSTWHWQVWWLNAYLVTFDTVMYDGWMCLVTFDTVRYDGWRCVCWNSTERYVASSAFNLILYLFYIVFYANVSSEIRFLRWHKLRLNRCSFSSCSVYVDVGY